MDFSSGLTRAVARRSGQPCRRNGGFTLIELMVTVVIVGIFAAIAIPSFASLMHRMNVRSAADEFYDLMQYARSEAVTRGTKVNVYATAGTSNIVVTLGTRGSGTTLRDVGPNGLQPGIAISAGINDVNFLATGIASASACFQITYPGDATVSPVYISLLSSGRVTAPSTTKPSGC